MQDAKFKSVGNITVDTYDTVGIVSGWDRSFSRDLTGFLRV